MQYIPAPPPSPIALGLQQLLQGLGQGAAINRQNALEQQDMQAYPQALQMLNPANQGFLGDLSQLTGVQQGSLPQMQSQLFKRMLSQQMATMLDPQYQANLEQTRKQTEVLGQPSPSDMFAREKEVTRQAERQDDIARGERKAALDLEIAQANLEAKKLELSEATDPKSIKRLTADTDLALKRAQLVRSETLSPEEFRHQFALRKANGDPTSPEYKQAMDMSVVQKVRTEIAQPGNKYKVPPGTIMQIKEDGTLSFPNKSLIQADKRPGREWYEPLNKSITALDNIKRLKAAMVPGGGGEDSVGVKDKIWTLLQKYTGTMPADKSVFFSNKAMMYSLIKQTSQESRMSDQDLQFLAAILPSDWQGDENFKAVLDSLETQSQASFNRDYEIISDPSMAIPVPSTYDAYYTSGKSPTETEPVTQTPTPEVVSPQAKKLTQEEINNFSELPREKRIDHYVGMGYSREDAENNVAQYKKGDIVRADGKKYIIKGFYPDGEPNVEEVK